MEPLTLPPVAAAVRLGISPRHLRRLILSGDIVARRMGSRTMVETASLATYLASLPVITTGRRVAVPKHSS
jgi:hypothetical protein